MTDTGYFQTSSGTILLLDIPVPNTSGTFTYERFQQQLAKGDLVQIPDDAVERVVVGEDRISREGPPIVTPVIQYRLKKPPDATTAAVTEPEDATPKRSRAPKG